MPRPQLITCFVLAGCICTLPAVLRADLVVSFGTASHDVQVTSADPRVGPAATSSQGSCYYVYDAASDTWQLGDSGTGQSGGQGRSETGTGLPPYTTVSRSDSAWQDNTFEDPPNKPFVIDASANASDSIQVERHNVSAHGEEDVHGSSSSPFSASASADLTLALQATESTTLRVVAYFSTHDGAFSYSAWRTAIDSEAPDVQIDGGAGSGSQVFSTKSLSGPHQGLRIEAHIDATLGPALSGMDSSYYMVNVREVPLDFVFGDMNGDGTFDNFDIQPFEFALTSPNEYQSLFQNVPNWEIAGDADADGTFDNFDIGMFERLLTQSTPAAPISSAAVPEPSGAMLCLVGALALFSLRRRSPQ